VIKNPEFPRHRHRKVKQPSAFGRPGKAKARAEGCDVKHMDHLSPFSFMAIISTHAGGQGEADSLALSLGLLVVFCNFFGQGPYSEETASGQFEGAFKKMRKTFKLPIFIEVLSL
jgi:hypothetical protein